MQYLDNRIYPPDIVFIFRILLNIEHISPKYRFFPKKILGEQNGQYGMEKWSCCGTPGKKTEPKNMCIFHIPKNQYGAPTF